MGKGGNSGRTKRNGGTYKNSREVCSNPSDYDDRVYVTLKRNGTRSNKRQFLSQRVYNVPSSVSYSSNSKKDNKRGYRTEEYQDWEQVTFGGSTKFVV